jgi:putative endonuclease
MSDKQARPFPERPGEVVPSSTASTSAMASWTVYLVECRDGSLYAGCTTDVERRVAQHNAGRGGAYTRSRRPVMVRYTRACASESEAKRMEAVLKSWPRSCKLALCLESSA